MELERVAKSLKELGHPTRLAIFQRMVKAGSLGIPVGRVQEELNIPGSTLSHHIAGLLSAGLIKQRREGRILYCVTEYPHLLAVINFLQQECCVDEIEDE